MKEMYVNELPVCSYCSRRAQYEFLSFQGPWVYGCKFHHMHFKLVTVTGGQWDEWRLVLTGSVANEDLPTEGDPNAEVQW